MRTTLLLVAAAVLLAVPAAALADGGSSSSTGVAKRLAAKKAKKLHVELKRGKTGSIGLSRSGKREIQGTVASVSPLTVVSAKQGVAPLTCDVPAGVSLAGLQIGDRVEVTCVLVGDRWALRKLEQKDAPRAGTAGSAQGPTAACDDDEDDDSGKLDDHDDDCGQLSDDEDDGEDDD